MLIKSGLEIVTLCLFQLLITKRLISMIRFAAFDATGGFFCDGQIKTSSINNQFYLQMYVKYSGIETFYLFWNWTNQLSR